MKRENIRLTRLAKATGRRALLGISVMLAAMTLAACSVEDNPTVTPTYEEEEDVYEAPEDPLGDFMAFFTSIDEAGNTVLGGYGAALDEADPTVLSIGVESLEEAERMFNRFVTDPLHMVSIGTGNITYSPVSRDGKAQGEIYFNAANDCIARITFSDDIPQDLVSEVRFIDKKLWPDNATSPYVVGKEYFLMKAYTNASQTEYRVFMIERDKVTTIDKNSTEPVVMLCIHDGSNGNKALFLRYKYLFNSSDKIVPVSYEHDEIIPENHPDRNPRKESLIYGAWWTETRGKGEVVRYVLNDEKNYPDTNLPTLSQLEQVYYTLRDMDKYLYETVSYQGVQKAFGSDSEVLDYWFWSQDYNKKGSTFNLYAWNFKTGESDYWRAYTHLGLLCQVITEIPSEPGKALRDKDAAFDDEYGIDPLPNYFDVFFKYWPGTNCSFTVYKDGDCYALSINRND